MDQAHKKSSVDSEETTLELKQFSGRFSGGGKRTETEALGIRDRSQAFGCIREQTHHSNGVSGSQILKNRCEGGGNARTTRH